MSPMRIGCYFNLSPDIGKTSPVIWKNELMAELVAGLFTHKLKV